MHSRCQPESDDAHNYADRGIAVAPEWFDYERFLADMGECPPGLTLDRINNDRGYRPGNCRWATRAVQRRNQRRIVLIDLDGEKRILKYACQKIGVTDTAVYQERRRKGISLQEAFDRVRARQPQRVRR